MKSNLLLWRNIALASYTNLSETDTNYVVNTKLITLKRYDYRRKEKYGEVLEMKYVTKV